MFSSRSFYRTLEETLIARSPSSLIWTELAPHGVEAFYWLVVLDKVSMTDSLKGYFKHFLALLYRGDINYLFLHCRFSFFYLFFKMVKILFKKKKTNYTSKAKLVREASALAKTSTIELQSQTTC